MKLMAKESIKAIREKLLQDPSADYLAGLATDPRKGVQQLLQQVAKRQAAQKQQLATFLSKRHFEDQLWPQYPLIAGMDEVGRGPLAGPVVTAAVILPHDFAVLEVNDSKQLSPHKRVQLYNQILETAVAVSVGVSDVAVIDRVNILEATKLAMQQAIRDLAVRPDYVLIDAVKVDTGIPATSMYKGDAKSISIASASIVAKVIRDRLMIAYDRAYPGYDLAQNAGYGTQKHLAGLAKYGITPAHRKSFAPVKKYL